MVNIMDMTSGTGLGDKDREAERYGEEVLNANWLPQPALALGLQTVCAGESSAPTRPMLLTDIDSFMSRLYSSQE
ncbi:MAG: hypothetical protein JWN23_2873 [Rhodocyclales bacterium]|nr:hypothetical protein [Rhodocyclales bacterium]